LGGVFVKKLGGPERGEKTDSRESPDVWDTAINQTEEVHKKNSSKREVKITLNPGTVGDRPGETK